MKIAVKDLEPNPYRDFDCYDIDRERIDGLKDSIKMDTFWGGIPVRPHPTQKGKYQIGSGHHRLVCLKENGIKEIDITAIHPFSDAQMLRIMINENAQYAARPKLVNSDVEKAKNLLDAELAKYETWEEIRSEIAIRTILGIDSGQAFAKLKGTGAGRSTILVYLGKPWAKRGWMIQSALATLAAEKGGLIDRESLELIPTIDQANIFRTEVKKHKTPKLIQKRLAKQIAKECICSKHIPDLVIEAAPIPPKKKVEPKELPMLDDIVRQTSNKVAQLCTDLTLLKKGLPNIQSQHVKNLFQTKLKGLKRITDELLLQMEAKNETQKKKVLARADS